MYILKPDPFLYNSQNNERGQIQSLRTMQNDLEKYLKKVHVFLKMYDIDHKY